VCGLLQIEIAMFVGETPHFGHTLMAHVLHGNIWQPRRIHGVPPRLKHGAAPQLRLQQRHVASRCYHYWLVVSTYPSEKYEFVSWDDDIPNIWKNNIKKKPLISQA
jgi:hypothetical protein